MRPSSIGSSLNYFWAPGALLVLGLDRYRQTSPGSPSRNPERPAAPSDPIERYIAPNNPDLTSVGRSSMPRKLTYTETYAFQGNPQGHKLVLQDGTSLTNLGGCFGAQALSAQNPTYQRASQQLLAAYGPIDPKSPCLDVALPSRTGAHSLQDEWTDAMASILGDPFEYIFAGPKSGSDMVGRALSIAFDWKDRHGSRGDRPLTVAGLTNAFHGGGFGIANLSTAKPFLSAGQPNLQFGELPSPISDKEAPAALHEVVTYIQTHGAGNIAAFLVEPLQGSGGDRHLSPEYLKGLRRLCDEYKILLIFDEIQTAMSAVHHNWFAFQTIGVTPDLVIAGKRFGLTFVAGGGNLLDQVDSHAFLQHDRLSSTFGPTVGGLIECLATIRTVDGDGLIPRMSDEVSPGFRSALATLATEENGRFGTIFGNLRSLGCWFAFDPPDRGQFIRCANASGVHLDTSGPGSCRIRLPLDWTAEETAEVIPKLRSAGRAYLS
jgi:L-lysine 6-transaminase